MRIELTNIEADILRHRLDAQDAVAEAVAETRDDWEAADVEFIVEVMAEQTDSTGIDTDAQEDDDHDTVEAMVKGVLADAVEGSTYVAAMQGSDEDEAAIQQAIDAGRSLAEKIGAFVGRTLSFPTC